MVIVRRVSLSLGAGEKMSGNIREYLFIIVVLFANIIEGITGFAGTMLAMPISMALIGAEEAKVILNMVALVVSSTIAVKTYKEVDRRELIKITILMTLGMVVGLYLFSVLPVKLLSVWYGVLIIAVAINGLISKKRLELPNGILILIVLAAGVIHGLFLSGGALLVVYVTAVIKKKGIIRATLAPVWLMLNSIILIQDICFGRITPHIMHLTVMSIIPVLLALVLGNYLHNKIKQEKFVHLTYLLLIISGLTLII